MDTTYPEALPLLHQRISDGNVGEPGPTEAQKTAIFRAALRAPDHGQLRPWRFLTVEGEARHQLGALLVEVETMLDGPLSEAQQAKIAARPLRAPLIVLVITRLQAHPKVPELEQYLSTAAAVQNMLLAAQALGLGAMWRTGLSTYSPELASRLGLQDNEKLLGFVYIGTPKGSPAGKPALDVEDFVSPWPVSKT